MTLVQNSSTPPGNYFPLISRLVTTRELMGINSLVVTRREINGN